MANAAGKAAKLYMTQIVDVYAKSGTFDDQSIDRWLDRYGSYEPMIVELDDAFNVAVDETTNLLKARVAASHRLLLTWSLGLFAVVVLVLYLFIGFYLSVREAIHAITMAMRGLAGGDLGHVLETRARDELGDLAGVFNSMRASIGELIVEVARFSSSTQSKAQDVSQSAVASQQSVDRQSAELELIGTSMSELVSSVQEVSRYSQSTADRANRAGETCREGSRQAASAVTGITHLFAEMNHSIAAILAVDEQSRAITLAIGQIRSVSEQTNLLALNAAIEAARAGEQGRGFAVVADEVRTLAIRSQALTGEIQQTIERLQLQVESAVKTIQASHSSASTAVEEVTRTADIFEDIICGMGEIIDQNIQIASAAEQQSIVVEGVERNTLEIRSLSESNALEAENTVLISDEVAVMTRDLHRLLVHFRV